MVLEGLGSSLRETLKKIANATHIDRKLVKEVVRDIQRALLYADVNVQLVLGLTQQLETRALTEKPPAGMSSREHVIRIIYEELVKILGETRDMKMKKQIILMVGLYGQGKTTTSGKLARFFQHKGLKPALIAADVHRPAAYQQLFQIAEKINVPIHGNPKATKNDAVSIVKEGLALFEKRDIIIIDTSGRHSLEDDLIEEVENIAQLANATERFLVLDAAVGQQAGPQAKAFHDAVNVTGVILTKLDGTAKGGGAISAVSETKAPIMFIGTGEHLEDIEKFEPARFISRLLGMGDIQTLLEKAQSVVEEDKAEMTARKLMSGKFTLKDMYEQMEMLSGMGPLDKVMSMLPSGFKRPDMGKDEIDGTQDKLQKFKVIMDSMTEEEQENPTLIKFNRIKRISRGAGVDPSDVRALLNYYKASQKAIKGFAGNRKVRKQLMKSLKMGDLPSM